MRWIKLTYATGIQYINLEKVYSIDGSTDPLEIIFYDSTSIMPISYAFATTAEKDAAFSKISSIINAIDIDLLAQQQ
jgi:hypothetical protein